MSIVNCDQVANQLGSANAGLAGAAQKTRSTEIRGSVRRRRFTFTIPASGAGSVNGDQINCGGIKVTDRIYAVRVLNPGLGAGVTLAIGKRDNNNSANNDNNHYKVATAANAAGIIDADTNLSEQMGADPIGDGSTGQAAPGFGNSQVDVMLTIGGGNPTAAAIIVGWYDYMGDEP